ncbi:dTDP-4-dehydrorhamnose reductase [Bdellovibrio sp.]|uniref:dTDP-4-dehydrorhamnose reductase n=1 Tax=Bdellovibrio sp. TaxID=28201 RepID=UPI0039E550C7
MRILIFGKQGQVGWELQRSCSVLGMVKSLGSQDVNFLDGKAISQAIRDYQPTHIVNAAAYTDVDKAETEENIASQINGVSVGVLAEEAKVCRAKLVHYSTDYVFDGSKDGAYTEVDAPAPLNAYGRSKLLGEKYIQDVGGESIIIRVTWLYGKRGKNFFKTMLRLGQEKEELRIVSDQVGAPTWCRHVSDATARVISDLDFGDKTGVYHMTPQGSTSWSGFAEEIFGEVRKIKPSTVLKVKDLVKIRSDEYPSPARRPRNSLMESRKIEAQFGIKLPHWQESLRMVIDDID